MEGVIEPPKIDVRGITSEETNINLFDIIPNTIIDQIIKNGEDTSHTINLYNLNLNSRWGILGHVEMKRVPLRLDSRVFIYGEYDKNNIGENVDVTLNVETPKSKYIDIAKMRRNIYLLDSNGIISTVSIHSMEPRNIPVYKYTPALRFKKIVTSDRHMLALTTTGQVYSMGANEYGQLGQGNIDVFIVDKVLRPIKQSLFRGEKIVDMSAGGFYSIFVSYQGNVYVIGSNKRGRLGLGGNPEQSGNYHMSPMTYIHPSHFNDRPIRKVFASANKTAAIDDEGSVYIWGDYLPSTPLHIDSSLFNNERMEMISMSPSHIVFLTKNGNIYTYGDPKNYKLGNQSNTQNPTAPYLVNDGTSKKYNYIYADLTSTFAITTDGVIYAFGTDKRGIFGNRLNPGQGPPYRYLIDVRQLPDYIDMYEPNGNISDNTNFSKFISSNNGYVALKR